ncbi:MAG: flavodoxin family protein [Methanobacteriaceae archaeon]|nr:flavodoxin family protein [Methanobacteriaceae archaeon]
MKTISIIASPRKEGNCITAAKQITKNTDNTTYFVDDMDISPCQACDKCGPGLDCAIKDDFLKIYDEIAEADALIFASPIYFGETSAQAKIFMDRFYSIVRNPDKKLDSKKTIFITAYAGPQGAFTDYTVAKSKTFESIGCKVEACIDMGNSNPLAKADGSDELAKKLDEITL